ncbi:MAG: ORF6N domain-containing protein [Suilimivivens sp.]
MDEIMINEGKSTLEIAGQDIDIAQLIYVIRGKQVMIDSDLAILYQVETKNINKAMKRNIKRFPDDFCFVLSPEEEEELRFQIGTSNGGNTRGGRRYPHYVYTEQGIAMLSAVLKSDVAIQVSIRIMKTFVEMRKYLANNAFLIEKINLIEKRQIAGEIERTHYQEEADKKFEVIFDYIESHKEDNQKIFFDGQIFDAFSLLADIIGHAKKEIFLIDGYIDVVTLNILAKKKIGVNIFAYTLPNARISAQDINNFNAQYSTLTVKRTTAFHDRFLIIDGVKGYHVGASLKDAGKKCFGINKILGVDDIKEIMKKAQQTST